MHTLNPLTLLNAFVDVQLPIQGDPQCSAAELYSYNSIGTTRRVFQEHPMQRSKLA